MRDFGERPSGYKTQKGTYAKDKRLYARVLDAVELGENPTAPLTAYLDALASRFIYETGAISAMQERIKTLYPKPTPVAFVDDDF